MFPSSSSSSAPCFSIYPIINSLPLSHLHVTMAIPWWWHTVRSDNEQLTRQLVARFRQALVMEFHHAFQIELERIVLLGGKTLVALWRCVGERQIEDDDNNYTIFDRHGEGNDPVVKLRKDIVKCFTTGASVFGKEPLTYAHIHGNDPLAPITPKAAMEGGLQRNNVLQSPDGEEPTLSIPPPPPPRPPLKRSNTIELKTPGLGDHDGFIHTTLARLPIDCLSMTGKFFFFQTFAI